MSIFQTRQHSAFGDLILALRWVKLEEHFEAATLETKWENHHAMDGTCF
jgi:hypothetical protein